MLKKAHLVSEIAGVSVFVADAVRRSNSDKKEDEKEVVEIRREGTAGAGDTSATSAISAAATVIPTAGTSSSTCTTTTTASKTTTTNANAATNTTGRRLSSAQNAAVHACIFASVVTKRAGEKAFQEKGRSMTAPDVIDQLGSAFTDFFPE